VEFDRGLNTLPLVVDRLVAAASHVPDRLQVISLVMCTSVLAQGSPEGVARYTRSALRLSAGSAGQIRRPGAGGL
jgi:hypothetical protein